MRRRGISVQEDKSCKGNLYEYTKVNFMNKEMFEYDFGVMTDYPSADKIGNSPM